MSLLLGRGSCDSGTCAPNSVSCQLTRQARTLLQYGASGSGVVATAESPEGIKQYSKEYIANELVPQAEATTRELQGEMDTALQAFESCNSALSSGEQGLSTQEATLITAEQRHNECEMKVAQTNRSEAQICSDWEDFAMALEAPVDGKEVNGSSPEGCLASLATMSEFYNNAYPAFLEKKKACELAKNGEEVTKEQCDADKKSIEESACSLKAARVQACKSLDSCFAAKSKRFNSSFEYVKLLEDNTKKHVQKHIDSCTEKGECKAGTVDLTGLTVNYPVAPQQMECDDAIKTDWDYSTACSDVL